MFNANMKLATQVHKELHTGMNGVIFLNGCNLASLAPQIELYLQLLTAWQEFSNAISMPER